MGRQAERERGRDWQMINARFSRKEWEAVRMIRNHLERIGKRGRMVTVSAALRYAVRRTASRIRKNRDKEVKHG